MFCELRIVLSPDDRAKNHPFRLNPFTLLWSYTAQGFEFDYVGVIFGRGLVYGGGWRGHRKASQDTVVKKAREEAFVNLVKQTYLVLLTRGMNDLLPKN